MSKPKFLETEGGLFRIHVGHEGYAFDKSHWYATHVITSNMREAIDMVESNLSDNRCIMKCEEIGYGTQINTNCLDISRKFEY